MELGSSLVVLCLLAGVVLAFGGAWLVLRESLPFSRAEREFTRVRAASIQLRRADELFRTEHYLKGLEALRRSVVIAESISAALLRIMREHHELVIGRFVALIERCELDFSLVVDLDFLLTQRHDLLALLGQVRERQNDTMLDDLVDFSRMREREIQQELRINRTSLFFALDKLCSELRAGPRERSAITYH